MKQEVSSDSDNEPLEANQRNPQRSTGPRTDEGKRVSSQNATKFGFFSAKALLPGESWEEFKNFREALLQQLCPRNSIEAHLVEQYIPLAWRLRRLPEIEAFAFTRYGISVQGNQCGPGFSLVASVQQDNILGQLARYEATLRKSAFKYLDLLRNLRKDGCDDEVPPVTHADVIELAPEGSPSTSPGGRADEVGAGLPSAEGDFTEQTQTHVNESNQNHE